MDLLLYNKVKKLADSKFDANGIYKSSWIVKEYKKLGGKYSGKKDKDQGLLRWYREKWINLSTGLSCGRKNKKEDYPLCRPSIKINKQTPLTVDEINKKNIKKLIILKKKFQNKKNVKFS